MADNAALKDQFFQPPFFDTLCAALKLAYPAFNTGAFLAHIYTPDWDNLALKEKLRHTTEALGPALPEDYRAALDVLRRAAAAMPAHDFGSLVFADFVEVYGLNDPDASLPALEQFTQVMSAEFAIRPFILRYPERTLAQMRAWTAHPSEAVRRLASEGCRPRLPWGIALGPLKDDPAPIIPILDRLKLDPSDSVRRSVANNLNDISKDNPDVVLDVLRGWRDAHPDDDRIAWIMQRGLRTLVKQGHPEALALLGYPADPAITVHDVALEPESVPLGGAVTLSFAVTSTAQTPQDLMIDYVLYLMRKNGSQTPKVFKLAKRTLAPGETITLSKTQRFRPVTTRKYYPGAHAIAVQINGTIHARVDFEVIDVG